MSFFRFWIWHKPWRTISPRCSWCRCRWLPWRGQRKVGSGRTVTSTPRASPTGPRSSPGAEGPLGRGGGSPTNHSCPLTAGRTVLPSIIFLGLFSSSSQTQMGSHQTPLLYKHYIFPSLQPFTDFRRQNHSSSPDTLLYRSPDLKNYLLPIINQVSVSDQVCTLDTRGICRT